MFSKILIANRGEIAVRIIRACKEMGISTVAVFSTADAEALHVNLADECVCIGPSPVNQSYLNMNAVIQAAVNTGAQAIHPGYGLLSENAEFAKLCEAYNITFIGPSSDIISRMGNKEEARKTMKAAGVPIIPGCDVVQNIDEAMTEAEKIGFPVLIKARSGGGGRGIRLVNSAHRLENAFIAASEEARLAFGDEGVYLEKYLTKTKHIEVQLLCDQAGNVLCLGERDCSVQRKNQKLIEESPAGILTDDVRLKMTEACIKAAKAIDYKNAGTLEFLLDGDNNFYFMEMNTRLQVEHPITEMVTNIDLVKWQIRIAAGISLPFNQEDIKITTHAIECRINAEDPYNDFLPSGGKIDMLHLPDGPWIRFDSAVYQGYSIPPFYDSMIGKLIVCAKTREKCIRKMQASLCELVIKGVIHTAEFQMELLDTEEFKSGKYTTDFVEKKCLTLKDQKMNLKDETV